jgi:large subunit ribosomal protein L9
MKVVLHEAVAQLGNRGDIVDVADGYARNYLIPKGVAQKATPGVEAQAVVMRKAWQQRNAADREAAESLATSLVTATITISARASGEGKLFGSVSVHDVVDAIKDQTSVELDRKMVDLGDGIKAVGSHSITVQPHAEVQFPVTVEVTAT